MNHVPEDMTVTVAGDVLLSTLQSELAKNGQWLPIDPPGNHTIRSLLDACAPEIERSRPRAWSTPPGRG